jgi:biofilm PGA synthesis N-glycosyltransferase PgaC
VAGSPHVTNRTNLRAALQIVEAASIVGLIRRTQAVIGSVGVVAGVLGLFRREAVLEVGGHDGRMATEDIDLSWRLLIAGWHTTFEPNALVGMQVPTTFGALWKQRCRWARGQGEVLNLHFGKVIRWERRWLWPLAFEAFASLVWAVAFGVTIAVAAASLALPSGRTLGDIGIAWGVALAVVATLQAVFALAIGARYDRLALTALLVAPLYTVAFWMLNALAAVRAEAPAMLRGPTEHRVVWDIPRQRSDASGESL